MPKLQLTVERRTKTIKAQSRLWPLNCLFLAWWVRFIRSHLLGKVEYLTGVDTRIGRTPINHEERQRGTVYSCYTLLDKYSHAKDTKDDRQTVSVQPTSS